MRNATEWIAISALLIALVVGQTLTIQNHCDRFLKCELDMMEKHRKCTNNSRNEVAQACDLVQDFSELSKLMSGRLKEFSDCVRTEAQEASFEFVEVDESCQSSFPIEQTPKSCWESVAQAKKRCQQLQSCCPAVKMCLKSGKNSPLTRALREKHSIINGRTSECRNDMRLVLRRPHKQDDPMAAKARAVLIAQGEKFIENIIQDERLEKFNQPHETRRLETTQIRMPLQDDMQVKMQALVKQLSKIILTENTKTENDVEMTSMASENFEITKTTEEPATMMTTERPIIAPKILVKKHRNEPILPSDQVRNLVTQPPHFSFALPPSVNLTKLNVFAARPELLYNTTSSPLSYRKTTIKRRPVDNVSDIGSILRRRLPPMAPPTFKVDSTAQEELTSRALIHNEAPDFHAPQESFVDAETNNEVDSTRRRKNRIFAANKVNASEVQLHLINNFRPPSEQDTTENTKLFEASSTTTHIPETSPTTTKMPEIPDVQIELIDPNPDRRKNDEDARLIKLLRQMHLKSEDMQMRIRVKSTRIFDKDNLPASTESPSTEKKVKIFTNTKPSIPEKVMMIDASTEFNEEPLEPIKHTTTTTSEPQPSQLKIRPDAIFSQKFAVPPVDADANQPLYGYRHKFLSVRRRGEFENDAELISAAKTGGHIRDDESQTHQKTNHSADTQLERTTIAYAPNRIMSVNLADVLVPINWKDIRRAPQRRPEAPFIKQIEENAELLQVQMDLIRNLEEFLERHEFETKHRKRGQIQQEEKRLAFLRREREEFERLNKKTGYCELYSVCTNQLKFVQTQCQNETSQETSKFFKNKFGSCNSRLWEQYKETDQLRMELLDVFGDCIIEEIVTEQAETLSTCPKNWPTLPFFGDQTECAEKTRFLHDHCKSLGKCCSSLKTCKEAASKHELFIKLTESKQLLESKARKCKTTTNWRSSSTTDSPITAQSSRTETIVPHQTSIRLI